MNQALICTSPPRAGKLTSLKARLSVAGDSAPNTRRGVARIYDRHKYESEMREAFDRWAMRLRAIVEPPPSNVVDLRSKVAAP